MKKIILSVLIASLTACSSTSSMFGGSDIQFSASESGMKAYADHISAIITNAKASNDAVDTPAYQLRREQNTQRTIRTLGWQPKTISKGEY